MAGAVGVRSKSVGRWRMTDDEGLGGPVEGPE